MSRSGLMAQLLRLARLAERSALTGENPHEALGNEGVRDAGRRRLMQGAVAGAATAGAGALAPPAIAAATRLTRTILPSLGGSRGVAVVGAGMAGLACATELARLGVSARVFEAADRVGGRCWSLRGMFPGQVAELGAEFIGTSHHAMLGYARALQLPLEEFSRYPGTATYHFGGRAYTEAQVLAEFSAFTACIRPDLDALSYPTAERFTEQDSLFDFMSLGDYLSMYGAGGLLRSVIGAAYLAEFGAGIDELSAISFLRFVYGDQRSKFGAYRGAGDRLHVVDGTDRIPAGLAARLPQPVQLGHALVAMRRLAGGQVRLTFDVGGRRIQSDHDAVVLALPFGVLRDVEIDASVGLPAWKRLAIQASTSGDSSKLLVGFKTPYWALQHGANGSVTSDLPFLQTTWESNPVNGSEVRALLSHQAGGALARSLQQASVQADTAAFLRDLEQVLPGASAAVQRDPRRNVLARVQNWSTNPLSRGAYACPRPGYFTSIAHNEAKPVGNVLFAGEHTSSFYEWQGFMEGAALSGLRAAAEVCSLVQSR